MNPFLAALALVSTQFLTLSGGRPCRREDFLKRVMYGHSEWRPGSSSATVAIFHTILHAVLVGPCSALYYASSYKILPMCSGMLCHLCLVVDTPCPITDLTVPMDVSIPDLDA